MYLAKCDQLVGRPSGYPITQCDVTVTLHLCGTLMDADNAAARCKFPLDFLVTRGWLKDDGPHVIQSFTVKQVREPRRADVRLVIEIQEAA